MKNLGLQFVKWMLIKENAMIKQPNLKKDGIIKRNQKNVSAFSIQDVPEIGKIFFS